MNPRSSYDSGPDCLVCGMKAANVVHDSPAVRANNIAPGQWAAPHPSMNGLDYYTWAEVGYHEFDDRKPDPDRAVVPRTQYERGYQAGFLAGQRARVRPHSRVTP